MARHRIRSDKFENLIRNKLQISAIFQDLRLATEENSGRPPPKVSIADSRRLTSQIHLYKEFGALTITFASNRYQWPVRDAIVVTQDDLWWMALPGDSLTISDQINHHVLTVANVDRVNDRISFFDQDPQNSMLLSGRNALGVEAWSDPLSISQAEFKLVAVGLNTLDEDSLIETVANRCSVDDGLADIWLRGGCALIDNGAEELCAQAAVYFKNALDVAKRTADVNLARTAEAYLSFAERIVDFRKRRVREPVLGSEAVFFKEASGAPILTADDLCRLGYSAGNATEWSDALFIFDCSIKQDPDFSRAYFHRAGVKYNLCDFRGSVIDFEIFIGLSEQKLEELQSILYGLPKAGLIDIQKSESEIAKITPRVLESYYNMARCNTHLEKYGSAKENLRTLLQRYPKNRQAYEFLMALEKF